MSLQLSKIPSLETLPLLRNAQRHKLTRAPMVNPYDKFSQSEFDAWIGDMTGSLRRALGYEQEKPPLLEKTYVNGAANGNSPNYRLLDLSDQDEVQDDSFAQIKSRRNKGKARDPREGPGLGRDRTQPIAVVSSDEEEEEEVEELAFSLRDESDVYDQDEDTESDYLISVPTRFRQNGVEESDGGSESEEYEDDDEEFVKQANDTSEVITISDEDENEEDDEQGNNRESDYHDRPGPSSFRYGGSDSSEDEVHEDEEDDNIQPLGDDTSFPPYRSSPHRNLELNDRWESPRKYVPDLYSGGELQRLVGTQIHPDHLGPCDEDIQAVEEDEYFSRPDEVPEQKSETLSNLRPMNEIYHDYSKYMAIPPLDQQFHPRFFVHAKHDDGDIDPSPNQSELRTHLEETDDPLDSGSRHQQLASILPSRRNKPIPQDVEIIAVDDSDDDSDGLHVIPPPDAILEVVTGPATEETRTNYSTPFFPVVVHTDNVGQDDALSVHTVDTEDIGLEPRLQSFEIVEPEAVVQKVAQESLAEAFDVGPLPSEFTELEIEEHDNPYDTETVEPEVALPNPFEGILPLDAGPQLLTLEASEQAPNYYEDPDDIYGTPVPEALPSEASDGGHIHSAEFLTLCGSQTWGNEEPNDATLQQTEVNERPQDSSSATYPETEANSNAEIPDGQIFHWLENNGVVFNDTVLESGSPEVISVDITNLYDSPALRGSPSAVSIMGLPEVLEAKAPEFTPQSDPAVASPTSITTVPGQPQIPMPVMADASVPDPTESPTRLQEHPIPILSIPATPDIVAISMQTPELTPGSPALLPQRLLHLFNPSADGLFTPADFSTATTPAEDSTGLMLPSEWQETDVPSSQTVAPVDLDAHTELADTPAVHTPDAVSGIIETHDDPSLASASEELTVSIQRRSVLITDPYPYCLSTPVVPTLEDGSSEETDDDHSVCSSSTLERENEKAETESAFPLAADIDSHVPSASPTMELEGTSVPVTDDSQLMPAITQKLVENTIIEGLDVLPKLNKDTLVSRDVSAEPHYPPLRLENSSTIPAETSAEGFKEQMLATLHQPLEVGVDSDFQSLVRENPEANSCTPTENKEAFDSAIPIDPLPPINGQVEQDAIPQATGGISPASRPSKRKREASPGGSDSSEIKDKVRDSKSRRREKEAEKITAEQPEHDTIHVKPHSSLMNREGGSAISEPSESPSLDQTSIGDKTSEFSKAEHAQLQLQFHAPPLFHAHGRAKRQKAHIQSIATLTHMRDREDQPLHQPATQNTSVSVNPPLQSRSFSDPPLDESPTTPTTTEAAASEVQKPAQSDSLAITESSQLSSTTVVESVPAVIQERTTTVPKPTSAGETHHLTRSILPATTPQLSPVRLLPASNSTTFGRSTRSRCKYHKIALPKGDNGPRVCFLVPGCSLSNQELMKEEEIRDLGEATYEDSLRIIRDIEDLNFDQYLIGILRQLVGLDILREGEVFYLPQPGDEVVRKHWPRRSISERTSMAKGNDNSSFAGSPGYSYSGSARSPSTRPPLSNADSVSASIATTHEETNEESDLGNDQEPSARTPADRTSASKSKRKPRKGRDRDTTFRPIEHEESPDEESTRKQQRRSTKRGVKRTRTHDGATGNDGSRKSKRLRMHLTDSSLPQAQHDRQ